MAAFSLIQTGIDHTDSSIKDVLNNLQANIIKHHGRTHAYHLFLKFKDIADTDIKNWITQVITPSVTTGLQQLIDSDNWKEHKIPAKNVVLTFSLSASGYRKLKLEATMPKNTAFTQGMKARKGLEDDISVWDDGFKDDIDALIIVADAKEDNIKDKIEEIRLHEGKIFSILHTQKGETLKNEHGIGLEHFGYADGISQPLFLKEEIENQGERKQWNDSAKLDILLVNDPGIKDATCFGSYLVFRKLEQNVKGFKEAEENIGKLLKDSSGNINEELAGAYIVGRFEDGTEILNSDKEYHIEDEKDFNNDFDYSSDVKGLKCPYHAHIRVTNPRKDVGIDTAKATRIIRRGIPYNDTGKSMSFLENNQPEGKVGLLFQCYQQNIEAQFEVIQERWANRGDINGHVVGQDGIIGQGRNNKTKSVPLQWGQNGPICPINFGDFVTTRGGEYFFTPSVGFLSSLNKSNNTLAINLNIKKQNKSP
jgi:Dyp-type peroxidase family